MLVLLVFKIAIASKETAFVEQVYSVMTAQGFEPKVITEEYYQHDADFKEVLIKCIAIEKEDIRFDFFEFNNRDSAIEIYQQAHSTFTIEYNATHNIETDHHIANYSIYTLDALGKYGVAIYVDNTAVYAYCNSENKNEINKNLSKIDYLKPGNNKETSE